MGKHVAVNRRSDTFVPSFTGTLRLPRSNSEARSAKRRSVAAGSNVPAKLTMTSKGLMASYDSKAVKAAHVKSGKAKRRVIPRTVKTTFTGRRKRWL
jgi:hypothetical protein